MYFSSAYICRLSTPEHRAHLHFLKQSCLLAVGLKVAAVYLVSTGALQMGAIACHHKVFKHTDQTLWRFHQRPLLFVHHPQSSHLKTSNFKIMNNVGRTLLLGLPQKQNGRPIVYIMLLMLISRPKRSLSHLWGLLYGLLPMAKIAEPFLVVRITGKVPNRKVAKSRIVLLVLVIVLDKKFALA